MGPILFSLLISVFPRAEAALTQIGAAAAVHGTVSALAPEAGQKKRALLSGKTVYFKDSVTTGPGAKLQIMLLDQTVFTLGPDSEMSLDEFVYDPFTDTGKVAAQVTKGVFRFVTGKIARKKPSAMKVKLPSGTMGIRGTIAGGSILPDGSVLLALLGPGADNNAGERPGAIDVTNAGVTVSVNRPGFAVIVRPGQPPSPPFQMTPEQLAQLDTKPKAEAGAGAGAGAGEPKGAQQDAKQTGDLGNAKTIAAAVGATVEESNNTSENAAQAAQDFDGIVDGQATWGNARAVDLTPIPDGKAHYFYNGPGFNLTLCGGAQCAGDGSAGNANFTMNIDFKNYTFGGGNSFFSVSDDDTINSTSISDTLTISQGSFASLSGPATISATGTNSTAQIALQNSGGNPATSARVSISFSQGSAPSQTTGSGTITAPRFNGAALGQ